MVRRLVDERICHDDIFFRDLPDDDKESEQDDDRSDEQFDSYDRARDLT